MIEIKKAIDIVRGRLSPARFQHSLSVAEVAQEMARRFDADQEKAFLAGILHDYAKGMPGDELLQFALANGLIEDEVEFKVPDLLHAPVGAFLVKRELDIKDEGILTSIKSHTLGSIPMSSLDKIIFLADMVEPGRDYPGQERLKCVALNNLDRGMLLGLECTMRYCLTQGRILHPRTIKVWNHFLEEISGSK